MLQFSPCTPFCWFNLLTGNNLQMIVLFASVNLVLYLQIPNTMKIWTLTFVGSFIFFSTSIFLNHVKIDVQTSFSTKNVKRRHDREKKTRKSKQRSNQDKRTKKKCIEGKGSWNLISIFSFKKLGTVSRIHPNLLLHANDDLLFTGKDLKVMTILVKNMMAGRTREKVCS